MDIEKSISEDYNKRDTGQQRRKRIVIGIILLSVGAFSLLLGFVFKSYSQYLLDRIDHEVEFFEIEREKLIKEKIAVSTIEEKDILNTKLEVNSNKLRELSNNYDKFKAQYSSIQALLPTMSILLLMMGFFYFTFLYLQGTLTKQPTYRSIDETSEVKNKIYIDKHLDRVYGEINDKIMNIEYQISTFDRGATITDDQKEEFVKNITKKIKSEASDNIIKDIEEKVESRIVHEEFLSQLDRQFKNTFDRLNNERSDLTRRGNLNLVLGIFTTIIGLSVLGYFVWKIQYQPNQHFYILETFIPRLSLVILIELFAYFFLKLYKSSLFEIKYFQNEISNFEAKYVSLRLAYANKDKSVFDEVLKILARTERNYVLEKGQSTIDIEREKVEKEAVPKIIDSVSEVIKTIKK